MNNIPEEYTAEWFTYRALKDGNELLKMMNESMASNDIILNEIELNPRHRERVIYWIIEMYKNLDYDKEQRIPSIVGMDSQNIALVSYCLLSCHYRLNSYECLLIKILNFDIDSRLKNKILEVL
jgi:hypothetical protein